MLTDAQFAERVEGIQNLLENSLEGGHENEWALVLAMNAVAASLLLMNEQMRAESERTR